MPATAAPDAADAARLFGEAKTICERDNGKFWGRSLCGPILLVDYTDSSVIANEADGEGKLQPAGPYFHGKLPESVIIANTPTEWSAKRWTQIVGPLPTEEAKFHVLVAHELFHRIQPALNLTRPEAPNHHLDTLEGRYLLQLEWRALATALKANTSDMRRSAIADVLLFRRERYRLFPSAAGEEAPLEINEGIPEYTGVMLGLTNPQERIDYALHDLVAFVPAPTFVRSFAYATGPAYGLLLDKADSTWRSKLGSNRRLDELLSDDLSLSPPPFDSLKERAAQYDEDGSLRASEVQRDKERREHQAALKAHLVDGPVLILPLEHSNYQFNPQTLTPLEGFGTVYPTMRLTDDWGALEVESGGALVRENSHQASVSAKNADAENLKGDGWHLSLNPGWTVQKGKRPGDLTVANTENTNR